MRRITKVAMALGAILALGVFSAGAAQAHTFLVTGVTLPALLLALAEGPQVFRAIEGGGIVTCAHARFHGKVEKESQETQKLVGEYLTCEAFGLKATVTPAEYELNANETVSVINKTIVIKPAGNICEIKIEPIAANQNLKKIKYLVDPNSVSKRLLVDVEVEKITSTVVGGGGACGAEGEHKEGLYNGKLLAFVHNGGNLIWS
jgi:hypothetical protein